MVNENNLSRSLDKQALLVRMIAGGVFNLILVSLFIFGGPPGEPEWGSMWVLRPILMVTFAGLCGGAVFYFFTHYLKPQGVYKVLAFFGSAVIYIIGGWMGMVLGFVGTWWN